MDTPGDNPSIFCPNILKKAAKELYTTNQFNLGTTTVLPWLITSFSRLLRIFSVLPAINVPKKIIPKDRDDFRLKIFSILNFFQIFFILYKHFLPLCTFCRAKITYSVCADAWRCVSCTFFRFKPYCWFKFVT